MIEFTFMRRRMESDAFDHEGFSCLRSKSAAIRLLVKKASEFNHHLHHLPDKIVKTTTNLVWSLEFGV
jgi:hypothetical protein